MSICAHHPPFSLNRLLIQLHSGRSISPFPSQREVTRRTVVFFTPELTCTTRSLSSGFARGASSLTSRTHPKEMRFCALLYRDARFSRDGVGGQDEMRSKNQTRERVNRGPPTGSTGIPRAARYAAQNDGACPSFPSRT
jgi:hypothetical protein